MDQSKWYTRDPAFGLALNYCVTQIACENVRLHFRTFMPPERFSLQSYAYKPPASGRVSKSQATKVVAEDECDPEVLWAAGVKADDVYYPRSADERVTFTLQNGKARLYLLVN